jgi:hypothetical protein
MKSGMLAKYISVLFLLWHVIILSSTYPFRLLGTVLGVPEEHGIDATLLLMFQSSIAFKMSSSRHLL